MRAVRSKGTHAEMGLRRELKKMGFAFRLHASVGSFRCRPDLVMTRHKLAIFVDGCFWHGCPKHGTWPATNAEWWRDKINANRIRDRRLRAQLKRAGWRVVRVWEHEDPERAAMKIRKLLGVVT